MARETFISYKYSEAQGVRDRILRKLGDDARYYRGETADSPNLTDTKVDNIKSNLRDMMYGTSVTIVVISPAMIMSEWIDWEIKYSLKEISRDGRTSKTNGIVGVIMRVNGSYNWLANNVTNTDGCSSRHVEATLLFDIINNNRFNLISENRYACPVCQSYDRLKGSFISLIEEDLFLSNPSFYIENAYEKSLNLGSYEICKA